jgi:uncharacterized protein with HEPN domain
MDDKREASLARLKHISEATGLIISFCEGIDEEAFISNLSIQSAVLYQFLVIGEAIRHVDRRILDRYDYPWHLPRSFRNYIAHEYFDINPGRVYRTVVDLLPGFRKVVDQVIEEL